MTTCPTWTGLGLNLGLCSDRLGINREQNHSLFYCAVLPFLHSDWGKSQNLIQNSWPHIGPIILHIWSSCNNIYSITCSCVTKFLDIPLWFMCFRVKQYFKLYFSNSILRDLSHSLGNDIFKGGFYFTMMVVLHVGRLKDLSRVWT